MRQVDWRQVEGFQDYLVSNVGDVYSKITNKILKQANSESGYKLVTLSYGERGNRKRITKRVHRLVAKAFIDNPDDLNEVNHIDYDKTNNRVENLEWCTRSYNQKYNFLDCNRVEHFRGEIRKSQGERVIQINQLGVEVERFDSISEATEKTGIYNISDSCNSRDTGKHHTSGGFIWVYEKDYLEEIILEKIKNIVKRNVVQLTKDCSKVIAVYKECGSASKLTGVATQNIRECCNGKRKTAGGYTWKYIAQIDNEMKEEICQRIVAKGLL